MRGLLRDALERRAPLFDRLAAEGTDAMRLFHGVAEGRPGLTVDRYGEAALVQTFRTGLSAETLHDVEAVLPWPVVWRHRGFRERASWYPAPGWAVEPATFQELGVRYEAPLVHRGQDPWLFLDFRAGRRWLARNAPGRSVLNTFAYTGGAGLVAARSGAASVTQLDHGRWCLEAAQSLAQLNGVQTEVVREDFFAAMRQWAGVPLKGRAVRGGFTRRKVRRFDIVVLDPPTFAKGPWGAVDIKGDYSALAKPSLLCLAEGGSLLATNHSPDVGLDAWVDQVRRCGQKAGRPVREVQVVPVDPDFPGLDGQPLLKMAIFTV